MVTLLILTMIGCTSSVNSQGYIKNKELFHLIEQGKAPLIVDVRSAWEYEKGHVPGAIHIPFWSAYFRSEQLSTSSTEPIVVYCEHGPRAGIGKFGLYMAGFNNIVYLKGHMAQWRDAELIVEK